MIQFFVDKENKVPLYLQLVDEIKYYISTGALGEREQLPPVKVLAKTLGINFLTVRKAYKELEVSGLLDIRHGEGTFISLTVPSNRTARPTKLNGKAPPDIEETFAGAARRLIEKHLKEGLSVSVAKTIVDDAFTAAEQNRTEPLIVFAECNQFQIDEISLILSEELGVEVTPSLVADLKKAI